MTHTFHASLIPALMRGLTVLEGYLKKAAAFACDRGENDDYYLHARLAPDMLPLSAQVRIATDTARAAAGWLANVPVPMYEGDELSVNELHGRITKTIAFVRSIAPAELEGAEARMIDQRFRGASYAMQGADFVSGFVLPNFYFHIAIAHGILRQQGIEIGKADYLGHLKGYSVNADAQANPRVRFLTPEQGADWLSAYGLTPDPDSLLPKDQSLGFVTDTRHLDSSEVITALLDDEDTFRLGALIRITNWIWDDEYDTDPTAASRVAAGEHRSLEEVPVTAFGAEHREKAIHLMDIILEHNWKADLYLPGLRATVRFLGDGRAEVHTCDTDAETTLRFRLIELGAACEIA
ncbi:MAG: DUF1993 domain-containing protein [Luteibacter sp.]